MRVLTFVKLQYGRYILTGSYLHTFTNFPDR
jgi:hypothetical protein